MDQPASSAAPVVASPSAATPDRLLASAGEIFAERGFSNATVREICERAGANIAAINYHFGDKRGLYEAVFRYAHACAPQPPKMATKSDPRVELRAYIRALLMRLLDEARPAWHAKLLARELIEPTGVLDDLVERSVRPHFDALQTIIRAVLGDEASPEAVRRCAASVIGQCAFYRNSRPILARLHPGLRFDADEIAALAEHVADFSLGGLARLHQPRATRTRARRRASRRVA